MWQALGLVALVVLVLVGALMPLKYTARLGLPRKRPGAVPGRAARDSTDDEPPG